jgi:hypothetical protein
VFPPDAVAVACISYELDEIYNWQKKLADKDIFSNGIHKYLGLVRFIMVVCVGFGPWLMIHLLQTVVYGWFVTQTEPGSFHRGAENDWCFYNKLLKVRHIPLI